jgi:N-acetylglucosamine malate deacetylase 2
MLTHFKTNFKAAELGRVLALAAHPDDETIACGGLLQRAAASLVVFAVDGAPPHYGFEKKFGSLQEYSETRFAEAARVASLVANCSIRRLARHDGSWFLDQHLFLELPQAFASLLQVARDFSPDLLVSHAFEGGHIDHDACHILAKRTARVLNLQQLEFPLYWRSEDGRDVFQQFRRRGGEDGECVLQLSQEEKRLKGKMLSEYRSQKNLLSVFRLDPERFRGVSRVDDWQPVCREYPFENRRTPLKAELFLKKIAEFDDPGRT